MPEKLLATNLKGHGGKNAVLIFLDQPSNHARESEEKAGQYIQSEGHSDTI